MNASPKVLRYGLLWPAEMNALEIELTCIRMGGKGVFSGAKFGEGLYAHYKNAMSLCWPTDDWHRWAELFLSEILANKITGVLGPQNSGKTYMASKYALIDYWAHPETTGILISSTDLRGLELRVWGTIKDLFNRAQEIWGDSVVGNIVDSLHAITTDETDKKHGRVLKKGIICIPCLQNGRYIGLQKYVGFKMPRVRLIADESQFMGKNFLDAISNLAGNPDFKAIIMGNPLDPLDPLGMACEPEQGWANLAEPTKTAVWKTKFMRGKCINFIGTDSPNFDPPITDPPRYRYMISKGALDEVVAFWGDDSQEYWSQIKGVMKTGLMARRVITPDLCREHHALEKAFWKDLKHTRIYAIDAAYSAVGGDRCVGGWAEFGVSSDDTQILKINRPIIIPIHITSKLSPEDQIAEFVQNDSELAGVTSTDIFYDSTGRGTLGPAFARRFKDKVPVPVEFGGRPTERPVRHDLFVNEGGQKRLQTCREYYLDFVSELWFSSRYIIECDQMRELPEDVMREGCGREYGRTRSNKIFVESKHDPKARERMRRSPDLYDWLVTICEGARQRGFRIQRLGVEPQQRAVQDDYWQEEATKYRGIIQGRLLTH